MLLRPLLVSKAPRIMLAPAYVPMRVLSTADTDKLKKFLTGALDSKGITGDAAAEVLKKLTAAQVVSIDLLKNLNHVDWEKTGVSVGAARAVQDALWQMKHDANEAKVDKTLKLRRESSTRTEMKQKRL